MGEQSHGGKQKGRGRLGGKVAIVTGAGTREQVGIAAGKPGTGLATATCFAREGAQVLLVDQSIANAEKTLAVIEQDGGEASVFQADVSVTRDCQAMVEAAVQRYGALHILVNNVGVGGPGTVLEIEEEEWDRILDINLKGMAFATKYAVPKMIESGGGSIIYISSIAALRASPSRNVPYAVSKAGIVALTQTTAVYHGKDNIRANCIAPGHIFTPMIGYISAEMRDLRRRSAALGTEGTAWDIARAALFLASDESRWITGVVLPVDGGVLAALPLTMLPYLQGKEE